MSVTEYRITEQEYFMERRDKLISALHDFAKGQEQRQIDLVIRQLQHPTCKDEYMADIFNRMKNCVSLLERGKFEVVVGGLLTVDWIGRSADVLKSYHTFIVNLVSAHSVYTPAVLRSLVSLFLPKRTEAAGNDGMPLGQLVQNRRHRFEEDMKGVHGTVLAVLNAVPMAVQTLSKVIHETFPYMLHKDSVIPEMYIQNILHVTIYCPVIRSTILTMVVEKMIFLDVRASRERIEEVIGSDSEDDDDDMDIFHMEGDLPNTKARTQLEEADRLDTIMCVMCNYIDKICKNTDGSLNWESSKKLYLELLSIFEKIILPTHECGHTQFLLFYICSFKQNLADGFMDYLWKKVKNPNEYKVYRKSAMSYLSSFIVRAKFMSIRSAADAISLFCEWIHQYIGTASSHSMHNDILHHGTFYGVVQAVLYILAFRQREFLEMDKADNFFLGLSLQTIVTCKLNPLRVCQPVVIRTFSSFVRQHQLAFCDTIIERNSRLMVPSSAAANGGSGSGVLVEHVEGYFPFDPYLLERSSVKFNDLYRIFEGTAIIDIGPKHKLQYEEDDFVGGEENGMSCYAKSPMDAFLGSVSPGFNASLPQLPR